MICEMCEVNQASVTIIPTGEGLPQSVCSTCMARMGLELAKQLIPAEEIAATLGPMFVSPAREDLHEDAAKVRKGRKSKAAPEATAPEGETGGPVEEPPTAANE